MSIEQLRSLQKRIREATGPDRELDWDIAKALDASFSAPPYLTDAPEFTLDPDGLGPCVALFKAVLPGACLDLCIWDDDDQLAHIYLPSDYRTPIEGKHRSSVNATLLAILSALIDQEEAKKLAAKSGEEEAKHTEKAG